MNTDHRDALYDLIRAIERGDIGRPNNQEGRMVLRDARRALGFDGSGPITSPINPTELADGRRDA